MLDRPEKEVVMLDLPPPISTNDIWTPIRRKGAGVTMVRSKKYNAWVSEAGFKLNSQRPGMVSGNFAFHLYVTTKSKLDLDNTVKATLDLLQSQGVISNDARCVSLRVKRANIDGMRCLVVATKEG